MQIPDISKSAKMPAPLDFSCRRLVTCDFLLRHPQIDPICLANQSD
jgi:hypothetical protein